MARKPEMKVNQGKFTAIHASVYVASRQRISTENSSSNINKKRFTQASPVNRNVEDLFEPSDSVGDESAIDMKSDLGDRSIGGSFMQRNMSQNIRNQQRIGLHSFHNNISTSQNNRYGINPSDDDYVRQSNLDADSAVDVDSTRNNREVELSDMSSQQSK